MEAGDQIPLIVQAIDEKLDFQNESFQKIITAAKFSERGFNYFSVFILGCQSTGKSTLLNNLFDTNFAVMVASTGRQQTTQGVWMGISQKPENALLVFDVEGTDAAERGESHVVFERKTSLFSLALSEILLINLFAHDVGRFEGSNLGLLRTVFELNLQLFQHSIKNKKLLFFVLRDHDAETSLDLLASRATQDIVKVWETIGKPPQYEKSTIFEFFDLEFVSLPHYKFQKEKWLSDVKELRQRFENSEIGEKYILKSNYKGDIPSDGFSKYAEKIWDIIVHEKDLDLPTQKQMLAIVRCDEIKKDAFDKVADQLNELSRKIVERREILENFGLTSKDILNSCLLEYEQNAVRYDRVIAEQKREELENQILTNLKESYHVLQKLIIGHCGTQLSEKTSTISKEEYQENVMELLRKIKDETTVLFNNLMESSIIPASNWSYTRESEEMRNVILNIIEKVKETQLNLWTVKMKEEMKKKLSGSLRAILDKADPESMWDNVKNIYSEILKSSVENILTILHEFEYTGNDEKNKIDSLEKVVYSILREIVEEKVKGLDTLLINKFKKAFLEDEAGNPISWGYDDDIVLPYKKAKIASEVLVDLFSVIRLDDKLGHCFFEPVRDSAQVTLVENPPVVDENLIVIPLIQAERILETFRANTYLHYQMAQKDKEHSASTAAVPHYLIALIVLLGANEAWYVVTWFLYSPLGILFLLFLGMLSFMIYHFNLWPMLYGAITLAIGQAQSQLFPKKQTVKVKEKIQ
jgi:hypothetical protein